MARQPRKQSGTGIYRKDQGNGSINPLSGNQIRSTRDSARFASTKSRPPVPPIRFLSK